MNVKQIKSCKIEGCAFKHKAFGFCNRHYRRYKVHGDASKVLVDHFLPEGESNFRWLYYIYEKNAIRRKLTFSLSIEEFRVLTSQNCTYCGTKPSQTIKGKAKKGSGYIYNGIDRKDANIGYVTENCAPCCSTCNYMKRQLSEDEFFDKIKLIYERIFR